ncbi:MAG TPA: ATP synthase F1 subunit gamma [Bacteroidales bacterium]|nr:MAG: ATP synthase F1 subunit gamma [Bacteroidetes bacterium GWF2_33_38]OFY89092.1 MAG: ATP synthase F1 subunit gamma [Bacteroidetes bacterium RIFOXYA2_FULL_33_7]HBF88860.1 ATP synthase F1 subunit gamma [Bacteroidales bacterium]
MANLKEIRTRISSVNSTKQITSAMKMVSAAKLRKAQDAIIQLRPYANKLHEILSDISQNIDSTEDNIYAQQRELKKVLIIPITSNRGLCGAFNTNVIKKSLNIAQEKFSSVDVSYLAIGKKSRDFFKNPRFKMINNYTEIFDELNFTTASEIADSVMQYFEEKKFDKIILVYNQFKNAGVQILTEEQFLPIVSETEKSKFQKDYIFEPNSEYIVQQLIPKSLKIQFFKALLDSNASEHGARMTAMHKATDNATELLKALRLNYNKARQAAITNEILEIVGGAEALKG